MAGKFSIRKAKCNANEGFDTTLDYRVLHCGNVSGNNNKFYCIELQKNSKGEFRLFTHYGRLGSSNIYEIRDTYNGDTIKDEQTARNEMDSIIKKKLKGKTKKNTDGTTYRENYEEVDVVAPSVGSENIHKVAKKTVAITAAAIDTSKFDKEAARILDQLIDENVHNITKMTSLKLTANGFETPLGPVTKQHCDKARVPLNILNKNLNKKGEIKKITDDIVSAQNLYFSLIPHDFGRKITDEDWILDSKKLTDAYDMLDQLETAVSMGNALQSSQANRMDALGSDLELLKRGREWERIERYIRNSKASNHHGTDVWKYRVKSIFKVRIPEERKRYEDRGKKLGNIKELFHGSRNCNILSIMKGGLIIPPVNAGHVTGRLYGNGLYFADNSTKSLNYSTGWWAKSRNKYSNSFLFLGDVAMGREYLAQGYHSGRAPKGYDSLYAQKGSRVYNAEYIVYDLPQATLKYLVEMEK